MNFSHFIKKSMAVTAALFTALSLTSCIDLFNFLEDEDFSEPTFYSDYEISEADTDNFISLGSSSTIRLSGDTSGSPKGKAIYYVNFNLSNSTTIKTSNLRYVKNYSGITSTTDTSILRSAENSETTNISLEPEIKKRHYTAPVLIEESAKFPAARTTSTEDTPSVTYNDFKIGTTKNLFVDIDYSDSSDFTFGKKTARLCAKKEKCLVWVIEDYYSETASGAKVNKAVAEAIAEKFTEYYDIERQIFGEEEDGIFVKSQGLKANSTYGSLVNIVIYDIGNDANKSNSEKCGIAGYFYSKDYYSGYTNSVFKYSNCGKFFYVDSEFCNANKDEGETVSSDIITTLFHEFQHMINFKTKSISGIDSSTWYNEMLSMLAEDMFATPLNLSQAVWDTRLPYFNNYYFLSGITEYNTSNPLPSYSTAYTLGAFLARNFGGIELISEISQNGTGDMESILNAIKTVTGEDISSTQLFQRFIQSVVFESTYAKENSLPTLYTAADSRTYNSKTISMPALDLYSDDFSYKVNDKTLLGPLLFGSKQTSYPNLTSSGSTLSNALRPNGFYIHYVGKATSDTVTLEFSSQVSSAEQVYIILQDPVKNTTN